MKPLSTGQPSTLGSYRDNCKLFHFTKAAEFFEKNIEQENDDEDSD